MIEIIAGEKGKGKTKVLLDKVNEAVKQSVAALYIWIRARNICMSWTIKSDL